MERISEHELLEVIADALQVEPHSLSIECSRQTVEGWDSLGHLNVLVALDKRTNRQAGRIAELATAQSVGEIIGLLREQGLVQPA